jgi:signal transduction histidine kinase
VTPHTIDERPGVPRTDAETAPIVVRLGGLRSALLALGAAGLVLGGLGLELIVANDGFGQREVSAVLALVLGWLFAGTGLFAWSRRPENRVGRLMTAAGFAWLVSVLTVSSSSWVYIVGILGAVLPYSVLIHLLLAYPGGRLTGLLDRSVVVGAYFATTALQLPLIFFSEPIWECGECPDNPLFISEGTVGDAIIAVGDALGVVLAIGLLVALIRRWRSAGPRERGTVAPVLLAGGATAILLVLLLIASYVGFSHAAINGLAYGTIATLAVVPFAFLAGLLRSRLSRAEAVSRLIERLGDNGREGSRGVRDALAEALADKTLTLAYWLPDEERYVDVEGHPVTPPAPADPWRAASVVERNGHRVAAIIHDRAFGQEPELIETAGAAVGLALENERLHAELRARIEDLRRSRARIVEAGDRARRRLERDLHDGAQQRLVALAISLRVARGKVQDDPSTASVLLDEATHELGRISGELRELARGIHPPVLAERGLAAALETLAGRAPIPVDLARAPCERLPEPVESAAYFLVAEALTNVARYARATGAEVSAVRTDGRLDVEVRDDGVGGANPGAGSGLRGLADRVAALDGSFEVVSPPGSGTVVRARIPCE